MSSTEPDDEPPIDPRILAAARRYLRQREQGIQPDRAALLAEVPELAEELSEYLDGIELAQVLQLRGRSRPASVASPPLAPEFDGQPLGDFKIVREIGRGGMAIVYEAIQLSLGRRVALKVLPLAASMDDRQLQRFQLESHAAAQLHHGNIVPVHAVGCDRGVHYYAMQLINGQPLSALIDDLKRQSDGQRSLASAERLPSDGTLAAERPGQPTLAGSTLNVFPAERTVPTQSRLHSRGPSRGHYRTIAERIAQIADALDYAHQAGIIHRDVKPGNLLLDAQGRIWVADFGLAQVTAGVGVTQTGDLLGTLRYMSPEQAAGRRTEIDHRTDIYSLGATMYEWLCLTPILAGQDRQHLLHQILHTDPIPPRQLDRRIPFELETILLKAVAKLPADRYSTAGEFAADLRRFIEERPILARRANLIDHARKWVRRHPGMVAATVMAMLFGMLGLTIAIAAISREQANTQAAWLREQDKAIEAEARLALAQRAADEMISIAEEELSDNPFEENLRQRLLDSALDYYQAFIAARSQNPDAQAELAATRDRVQRIIADLKLLQADRESLLLTHPQVLEDLRLDDMQKTALRDWFAYREQVWRAMETPASGEPWTPGRWQQARLDAARDSERRLAEFLLPQQRTRLRQLALQIQGARALQDPDVAEQLRLTGEQKRQLREIESEFRRPPTPRHFGGSGPSRGPRPPGNPALFGNKPPFVEPNPLAEPRPLAEPSHIGPPRPRDGAGPRLPGQRGPNEPPHGPRPDPNFDLGQQLLERSLSILRPDQRRVWDELIGEPWEANVGWPGHDWSPPPPVPPSPPPPPRDPAG